MDNVVLFMLVWLTVKFIVDLISIVFIFWRLTHHFQLQGVGKHKGDVYFLTWLGIKFVVDIVFITVYCLEIGKVI